MTANYQGLELLVADLYRVIDRSVSIEHNAKVLGRHSRRLRQIDVALRARIGGHELLIAVECKRHKRPVDVELVESFIKKLEDISAPLDVMGVMVSPSGFTRAAKNIAKEARIELLTLNEVQQHDWNKYFQTKQVAFITSVPVLYSITPLYLSISVENLNAASAAIKYAQDNDIQLNFFRVTKEPGELSRPIGDLAATLWREGRLEQRLGRQQHRLTFSTPATVCVPGGGEFQVDGLDIVFELQTWACVKELAYATVYRMSVIEGGVPRASRGVTDEVLIRDLLASATLVTQENLVEQSTAVQELVAQPWQSSGVLIHTSDIATANPDERVINGPMSILGTLDDLRFGELFFTIVSDVAEEDFERQ